jgi:hypothetical protein
MGEGKTRGLVFPPPYQGIRVNPVFVPAKRCDGRIFSVYVGFFVILKKT